MAQTTINPIPGAPQGQVTSGAAGTARRIDSPSGTATVAPKQMTSDVMGAPTPSNQGGVNFNPVSNPTHPAHQVATQHLGQALGHMLTGNHEAARDSLHTAIEHLFVPHQEAAAANQAAVPQPRSGDVANELRAHIGNLRAMRQGVRQIMRGATQKKKPKL